MIGDDDDDTGNHPADLDDNSCSQNFGGRQVKLAAGQYVEDAEELHVSDAALGEDFGDELAELERRYQRNIAEIMCRKISATATEQEHREFMRRRRDELRFQAECRKQTISDMATRYKAVEGQPAHEFRPTAPRQVGARRGAVQVVSLRDRTKQALKATKKPL
jgi:hypothetical protein